MVASHRSSSRLAWALSPTPFVFDGLLANMSNEAQTMNLHDHLLELLTGPLATAGFEVVDVVCAGSASVPTTITVLVDLLSDGAEFSGGSRVDLEQVSIASRQVSEILDEHDLIEGAYTLEVSSPGLERPLRTPEHFRRQVGQLIKVKLGAGANPRRLEGTLESVDDSGVVVAGVRLVYSAIERANTVFVWGPAPKPKGPPKRSTTPTAAPHQAPAAARQGAMR